MRETTKFLLFCVGVCVALATVLLLAGCGSTTTYNIHVHPKGISYADEVKVVPGQGGDTTDSSALDAAAQGGEGLSPGSNIVNRGFADYGVIFNIGTETPTTTEATTDANLDADVGPTP